MPTRDRIKNPSINWPESEEEAFQAIVHHVRKGCFESRGYQSMLNKTYTTDSGLGTTRSQEQADWLNRQQGLVRARLEDFLDQLDLENRINPDNSSDETTKEN